MIKRSLQLNDIASNTAPVVSIGIPVYNGAKYIRDALDSTLAQDYTNLEIIISDNASTDSTAEICKEYMKRDSRIRYYCNEKNIGAAKNFSHTLKQASGKYFTWLAHDDLLCEQYVRSTVNYLEKHHEVVLCSSSIRTFFDEDPQATNEHVFEPILESKNWNQAILEIFRWSVTEIPIAITLYGTYRTEVLKKNPYVGSSYRNKPDFPMDNAILASLCAMGRIVALPEVLRIYRCNLESCAYEEDSKYFGSRLWLALRIKLSMLKIAMEFPASWIDKMNLLKVTLRNFIDFKHRPSIRVELKKLRNEIRMLRQVCAERLTLIDNLTLEANKRLEIINELTAKVEQMSQS